VKLQEAADQLQSITMHLIEVARTDGPEAFPADASLYLGLFDRNAVGWRRRLQGLAAQRRLERAKENEKV